MSSKDSAEQAVRDIRRRTRKQYSAEEKIRIVLAGLRGEDSVATRFEKHAANYLAMIKLAAIRIWLRVNESMA